MKWPRIIAAAGIAGVLSIPAALSASAESDAASPKAAPPAAAASDGSAGQPPKPLSEKLKEHEGVIRPPGNVDPGIHKEPPQDVTKDNKMPVIVPPGEPGGDQSVQPK